MGINVVFIGTEYQVGLAGALEADAILGTDMLRKEPDFVYMGDTVEIPKLQFTIGMADNAASTTTGVTPGSDSSDMIEVTVRRLDGAIDIESGKWQKHDQLGTAATRDERLAKSFAEKARVLILTGVMSALAGVSDADSTKVVDITGATEVADQALGTMAGKAARVIIQQVLGKHGTYAPQVKYIIAHSDVVTVLGSIANDSGVPYYQTKSPRGYLLVEGAEVIPCNVGTKASTTYSTFFVRPEALAFGTDPCENFSGVDELSGDDITGPIVVDPLPTSSSGTRSYRFSLKSYYFVHLYSTTDGAPLIGVSLLKSKG